MDMLCSYRTDKGLWKEHNQDSLCIKSAETSVGTIVMAVLCDGMGGLKKGEIASAVAVNTFEEWFTHDLESLLEPFSMEQIGHAMEECMNVANRRILSFGEKHGIHLGTTCSVLLLIDRYFYMIVHIGDTRIYEMGKAIRLLTTDHTLVEQEVAMGRLTSEEARKDARRNILLQCLGDKEDIYPETTIGAIGAGNVFVLCSDGFYQECSFWELQDNLSREMLSEEEIAHALECSILQCRERKEKDDITAVVLKI